MNFRKCPKTIDKPFTVLELEIEEICLIFLFFYFLLANTYLFVTVLITPVVWFVAVRIKKNKPEGALLHFLYKYGINIKGFIKQKDKNKKLSSF